MKARTDQAHTVIIGEARSPVGVSLGLRLIGDEELATVTITQRNKTTTLAFTDSAHAARIADALLGYQPYAVVASRKEAEGERPPAPAVQGEPGVHTFYVLHDATEGQKYIKKDVDGGCLAIFEREDDAQRAKRRHPGTEYKRVDYYTAPQPSPDVSALVEALERIANLPLNSCSTENDYRLSAAKAIALAAVSDFRDAALAAHRKQGGEK